MSFSELIAVYLFLGGASAGAFALVALADVAGCVWGRGRAVSGVLRAPCATIPESTRRYVQTFVYGTGLASILAGVLCLVADLGRPEAFYYLFLYPTNSLVSIGAFALAFLSVCLVVALSDALLRLPLAMRRFVSVVKLAGIPVALIVMVYTALLLKSVIAVKVWQSPWLSVLFVASALSCGCAVVMLAACACEDVRAMRLWHHFLIPADVAFIVIESIAAIALLVSAEKYRFGGVCLPYGWRAVHSVLDRVRCMRHRASVHCGNDSALCWSRRPCLDCGGARRFSISRRIVSSNQHSCMRRCSSYVNEKKEVRESKQGNTGV